MARPHRTVLLLALAALLALTSTAAADSYLSLGIGVQADLDGSTGSTLQDAAGRSGRIAVGQRMGVVAVEAGVFGTGLGGTGLGGTGPGGTGPGGAAAGASLISAAAELKLHLPLSAGLELYGKGGFNHGWVTVNGQGVIDDGSGIAFGAGIQFRVTPGPVGSAAIWLDYTHQEIALSNGTTVVDMTNIGVSVGI